MSHPGIQRWRLPRSLYIVLSVLGGVVPWATALLLTPAEPASLLHSELGLAMLGAVYLAVLSYPFGVLGSVCLVALSGSGAVTPTECLLISMPVSAALGYFQWYVWLPKAFA